MLASFTESFGSMTLRPSAWAFAQLLPLLRVRPSLAAVAQYGDLTICKTGYIDVCFRVHSHGGTSTWCNFDKKNPTILLDAGLTCPRTGYALPAMPPKETQRKRQNEQAVKPCGV